MKTINIAPFLLYIFLDIPMVILHATLFALFGQNKKLISYWNAEVINRDKFILHRLLRNKNQRQRKYLFWWRLANEMYMNGTKRQRKAAIKINHKLISEFGCDIGLGANIGKRIVIPHHSGVVIHGSVDIGDNFIIRQNCTIGQKDTDNKENRVSIGNNVDIGANSCVIGLTVKIGDNVKIGAMSFVLEDIPSNCTYVTTKPYRVILNEGRTLAA